MSHYLTTTSKRNIVIMLEITKNRHLFSTGFTTLTSPGWIQLTSASFKLPEDYFSVLEALEPSHSVWCWPSRRSPPARRYRWSTESRRSVQLLQDILIINTYMAHEVAVPWLRLHLRPEIEKILELSLKLRTDTALNQIMLHLIGETCKQHWPILPEVSWKAPVDRPSCQ